MSTMRLFVLNTLCILGLSVLIPLLGVIGTNYITGGLVEPPGVLYPGQLKRLVIEEERLLALGSARTKKDQERLAEITEKREAHRVQTKSWITNRQITFFVLILLGLMSLLLGILIFSDSLSAGLVIGGMLCLGVAYLTVGLGYVPAGDISDAVKLMPLLSALLAVLGGIFLLSLRRKTF